MRSILFSGGGAPGAQSAAVSVRIRRRSVMNLLYSAALLASSGNRRRKDGCTVTNPCTPPNAIGPRSRVTDTGRRTSALAAVAPSATTSRGRTNATSRSSHQRHADTSSPFGFLCRRRLPRGSYLKCFTALVR